MPFVLITSFLVQLRFDSNYMPKRRGDVKQNNTNIERKTNHVCAMCVWVGGGGGGGPGHMHCEGARVFKKNTILILPRATMTP